LDEPAILVYLGADHPRAYWSRTFPLKPTTTTYPFPLYPILDDIIMKYLALLTLFAAAVTALPFGGGGNTKIPPRDDDKAHRLPNGSVATNRCYSPNYYCQQGLDVQYIDGKCWCVDNNPW
jgi:hypothetical protein